MVGNRPEQMTEPENDSVSYPGIYSVDSLSLQKDQGYPHNLIQNIHSMLVIRFSGMFSSLSSFLYNLIIAEHRKLNKKKWVPPQGVPFDGLVPSLPCLIGKTYNLPGFHHLE